MLVSPLLHRTLRLASTGFATRFPELYGGVAYSDRLFVSFNMLSYTIFTLACLAAFVKGHRFLLMPVLFFVVYGAIESTGSWVLCHCMHSPRTGAWSAY